MGLIIWRLINWAWDDLSLSQRDPFIFFFPYVEIPNCSSLTFVPRMGTLPVNPHHNPCGFSWALPAVGPLLSVARLPRLIHVSNLSRLSQPVRGGLVSLTSPPAFKIPGCNKHLAFAGPPQWWRLPTIVTNCSSFSFQPHPHPWLLFCLPDVWTCSWENIILFSIRQSGHQGRGQVLHGRHPWVSSIPCSGAQSPVWEASVWLAVWCKAAGRGAACSLIATVSLENQDGLWADETLELRLKQSHKRAQREVYRSQGSKWAYELGSWRENLCSYGSWAILCGARVEGEPWSSENL